MQQTGVWKIPGKLTFLYEDNKMWKEYLLCFLFDFLMPVACVTLDVIKQKRKKLQMAQVPQFLKRVFYPFHFDMNNSCIVEI